MRWPEQFDGIVLIGGSRAKGIWAAQYQQTGAPVTRTGARLNSSATSHTLLTLALTLALQSITNRMAAEIVTNRMDGRNKPSLLVKLIDETYADALTSFMQGQQGPPLRVIKSLYAPLARASNRFNLTFETERSNPAIFGLLEWAKRSVLLPADVTTADLVVPPSLMPMAVNSRGGSLLARAPHRD